MRRSIAHVLGDAVYWLGVAAIVIVAPSAWLFSGWNGAGFAVLWGLLLIVVGRFDRVTQFSFGATGLMVQLQQKIDEATATLEQVRSLATATSFALLSELMAGEFSYGSPLTKRIEVRNRIIAELKSLKLPDEKLRQAEAGWQEYGAILYTGKIRSVVVKEMKAAGRSGDEIGTFESEFKTALQPNTWTAPTASAVREFLQKRGLLSAVAAKWIEEYQQFLNTGEIRRPDEFSAA